MTAKWASPGHFHSLANSDQAWLRRTLATDAKMFQAVCVIPEREERSSVGRGVGGDSGSQRCIWEQLCPRPGLKLNRPQPCLQA